MNKCAIKILNEQAGFYRGINNWEKCEEAFSNLYHLLENIQQIGSQNHAIVMLNHATALQMQGNFYAAEKRFIKAEEILKREKSKENDYILAGFYNNSVPIYLHRGELEKALNYQQKAVDC